MAIDPDANPPDEEEEALFDITRKRNQLPDDMEAVPAKEAVALMSHAKNCQKRYCGGCPLGEKCFQWKNAFLLCKNDNQHQICCIKNHIGECANPHKCEICYLDICLCSIENNPEIKLDMIRHLYYTQFDRNESKTRFFVSLFSDFEFATSDLETISPKNSSVIYNRNSTCSICIQNQVDTCLNSCGHQFCRNCIKKWARFTSNHQANTCPLCRERFDVITQFDENDNVVYSEII